MSFWSQNGFIKALFSLWFFSLCRFVCSLSALQKCEGVAMVAFESRWLKWQQVTNCISLTFSYIFKSYWEMQGGKHTFCIFITKGFFFFKNINIHCWYSCFNFSKRERKCLSLMVLCNNLLLLLSANKSRGNIFREKNNCMFNYCWKSHSLCHLIPHWKSNVFLHIFLCIPADKILLASPAVMLH